MFYTARCLYCCRLLQLEYTALYHVGTIHALLLAREIAELRFEAHHVRAVGFGFAEYKMPEAVDRFQCTFDAGIFVLLFAVVSCDGEHYFAFVSSLVYLWQNNLFVEWVL